MQNLYLPMSSLSIMILGSSSLDRYSKGILHHGFLQYGAGSYEVEVQPLSYFLEKDTLPLCLIQVHGAPSARHQDENIIASIPQIVNKAAAVIILMHRPDQVCFIFALPFSSPLGHWPWRTNQD
jgi:hypothetical protein